ncbi:leader peptidase (prepilin peptidase) / N-methyltransferase [Austwickia chelonae]|nr:leader peptidase (prepilin peptidase) / N-methyltransferase [Austwickia chelonae]
MAVALGACAAGYGALCGVGAHRALSTGRYRRYADERERPLPTFRWVAPVCALLTAVVVWRLIAAGDLPASVLGAVVPGYVVMCAIDLDVHRLPDVLTLPAYPVLAAGMASVAVSCDRWPDARRALWGGLATWLFFVFLALLSRGQLGWGDVKLSGSLGALLGWFSWGHLLVGVYAMFLCGGAAALWLLVRRRSHLGSRLAFGPSMVIGAWGTVVVAAPL